MDHGHRVLAQWRRRDPVTTRVALITGASGGLGRALVRRFEGAGWQVAATGHRHGPFRADLAEPDRATGLVTDVVATFGRLDLLVANHAAMSMAPVEVHDPSDWWRIVDTNLSGSFHLARAAVPHLRASRGSIVFVASEWGVTGWANASAYAASKAGLIGLTRSLALELAPEIRVNAIAPGVIDTPQLRIDADAAGVSLTEIKRRYVAASPVGRIGTADEIAASVLFLSSPDAGYYTGQALHPNGGTTRAS
jgi:NAD(P)-dependent dehydrogenase (short-subunit alcohol dehydrogenase family)